MRNADEKSKLLVEGGAPAPSIAMPVEVPIMMERNGHMPLAGAGEILPRKLAVC